MRPPCMRKHAGHFFGLALSSLLFFVFAVTASAQAQITTGVIQGIVQD